MKTTKNTTSKQTKKTVKPAYVVDLVGVDSEYDAALRIALCKYENNACNFTTSDINIIKEYIKFLSMTYTLTELINAQEVYILGCGHVFVTEKIGSPVAEFKVMIEEKRPNIFKRFWDWITRKK